MSKSSYLSNTELIERVVDDIVQMHNETGIDLAYWDSALELVRRYYDVDVEVIVHDKRS